MRTIHVALISSALCATYSAFPADAQTETKLTNQVKILSLKAAGARFDSNPPAWKSIRLGYDLGTQKPLTNSWFQKPGRAFFSPDIEKAERINAQLLREKRRNWERTTSTGRGLPGP
jgi:hypothetical protein